MFGIQLNHHIFEYGRYETEFWGIYLRGVRNQKKVFEFDIILFLGFFLQGMRLEMREQPD